MIIFKDILRKLSDAGWSTYRLHKEKVMGNGVIDRIRKGESITTNTINIICKLCKCQPGDLLEYRDSTEDEEGQG